MAHVPKVAPLEPSPKRSPKVEEAGKTGAAAQAKSLGTDPALVFIPHPVQDRTDDELKKLADDHFEAILALLVQSS